MENKKITAAEFDAKFEAGEDMSEHVDFANATKMVNVDLPVWAVKALDAEAGRRNVARQALIKMWITDRLDRLEHEPATDEPVVRLTRDEIRGIVEGMVGRGTIKPPKPKAKPKQRFEVIGSLIKRGKKASSKRA